MTIDGDLQITEMDECHYHEMMVHVPLASRPPGAGTCVEIVCRVHPTNAP